MNWDKLRSDGNIQKSFEGLISQLAGYEEYPADSSFVRIGPPDGGVECYWELSDGKQVGWQAKYFLRSLKSSEWTQIDKSFKKAIKKYPNLSEYVICLPIDLSNSPTVKKVTARQKWNDKVKQWKKLSKKPIKITLWGDHEITKRLNENRHKGKLLYFFNETVFSKKWFENHISEMIEVAGPRYTPELNVRLPILEIFDYLGRTQEFCQLIKKDYGSIKIKYKDISGTKIKNELPDNVNQISILIDKLTSELWTISDIGQGTINWNNITQICVQIIEIIEKCLIALQKKAEENKEKVERYRAYENYGIEINHFTKLSKKLQDLCKKYECNGELTNNPLLLTGPAGIGKTHLLCDVAKNRTDSDMPTIFVHGSRFSNEEPWVQILKEIGLTCTREDFLEALESAAQSCGRKAMMIIDAINESGDIMMWNRYLAQFINIISRYPWISLAISVRDIYENMIVPENIRNKICKIRHLGFDRNIEESTKIFFDGNGIERPRIPLMVPEFSNPQFLHLLLRGLQNKKLTSLPEGIHGLNSVYDFFIDSVNEKLACPDQLDYDKDEQLVKRSLLSIAKQMANNATRFLTYDESKRITSVIYPSSAASKSILNKLISEGLLNKEHRKIEEDIVATIQFTYDRFGDNQIAKFLLDEYLNEKTPAKSFTKKSKLNSIILHHKIRSNLGIFAAFAIHLPERINKEILEMNKEYPTNQTIASFFINSLMWRDPKKITRSTKRLIDEIILNSPNLQDRLFKVLLHVATNPNHYLNAEYLHDFLKSKTISERDQIWSVFIHNNFIFDGSIVRRLIEWVWNTNNKSNLINESAKLYCITLAWFCTSSNREIRDKSTKALVSLFEKQPKIITNILEQFNDVNDSYVLERVYCAAYGFAIRSRNKQIISEVAQKTYDLIFKNNSPPLHLLLRNYARGIIEAAIFKKCKIRVDENRIRPPYKSEWLTIPSDREIVKYGRFKNNSSAEDFAQYRIYQSVMNGDFGRYVIGTNSDFFDWCNVKLLNGKSRIDILKDFENSLTAKQKKVFDACEFVRLNKSALKKIPKRNRKKIFGSKFEDNEFDDIYTEILDQQKKLLIQQLRSEQKTTFQREVIPSLDLLKPTPYEEEKVQSRVPPTLQNLITIPKQSQKKFDLSLAQRWIIRRVFQLGWSKKKFGQFDSIISRPRMADNQEERIGKKYQWIAYYEFLGAVSDNFEFKRFSDHKFTKYDGPYQLSYGYDIDPSFLYGSYSISHFGDQGAWWFPIKYSEWHEKKTDKNWLETTQDIPFFNKFLENESCDGTEFFVLNGYFTFEQPTPVDVERYTVPTRQIWLRLDSYLVPEKQSDKFFSWMKKQDSSSIDFPDHNYDVHALLSEHYWANPFQNFDRFESGWKENSKRRWPSEFVITCSKYNYMSDYDASFAHPNNIAIPSKILADGLEIDCFLDGKFYKRDKLIAYDPSVDGNGPSALIVNKKSLLDFLKEKKLRLIWSIVGRKQIIGEQDQPWQGDLKIYGVYKYNEDGVQGKLKTNFVNKIIKNKI